MGPGGLPQHPGELGRQLGEGLAAFGSLVPSQSRGDLSNGALEEMAAGDTLYRVQDGVVQLGRRRSILAGIARREALQQSLDHDALSCRLRPIHNDVPARRCSRLRSCQRQSSCCTEVPGCNIFVTWMRVARLRIWSSRPGNAWSSEASTSSSGRAKRAVMAATGGGGDARRRPSALVSRTSRPEVRSPNASRFGAWGCQRGARDVPRQLTGGLS